MYNQSQSSAAVVFNSKSFPVAHKVDIIIKSQFMDIELVDG